MEYSMRWVRGHIEVYDGAGRFLFSADRGVRTESRDLPSSTTFVEMGRSLFDVGRGSLPETPPLLRRTCTSCPLSV